MATLHATLRRGATAAGALAALTGLYGALSMMGAFGPASRWTSVDSDGTVRAGTESGIDYLFGSTGGNAPVLFFWSMALLLFVAGTLLGLADRRGPKRDHTLSEYAT